MFSYLETLPQWLENTIIIIFLIALLFILVVTGYFFYRIIKKIKDIKFKVSVGAASAEADIQIEASTTTEEIKPSEPQK